MFQVMSAEFDELIAGPGSKLPQASREGESRGRTEKASLEGERGGVVHEQHANAQRAARATRTHAMSHASKPRRSSTEHRVNACNTYARP
eukprot:2116852-Pleurochrysis_carterae.AAC.1